jgi:hypothetical protein
MISPLSFIINQCLPVSSRTLLSGVDSIALESAVFKIQCSREQCEKIYGAIALLILGLRSTFNSSVAKVELFDTDNQIRFVAFELWDERML